jgi:hypothetical protein
MNLRTKLALPVVTALGVVAISGTALAGHQTSGVKSYTGCLVGGEGVMIKIKEGNAPRSACTGGQVEAHFSGGDITKISVTGGLTMPGGASSDENGEVTIALDASHSLPQGCAPARVAKWNGTAWVCGIDNDTTYSAGTGLDLSAGNELSIEPDYQLPGKSCSTAGQFARGFNSTGDIQCAAPSATAGAEVWQKVNPAYPALTVVALPKGEGVDVVIMPLPAGTFLITAVARVSDNGGDDEVHVNCLLRNGAFNVLPVHEARVDIGDGSAAPTGTATVHGLVTLANPDSVRFTCTSAFGDDEEDDAVGTMTAIKVGTVHTP